MQMSARLRSQGALPGFGGLGGLSAGGAGATPAITAGAGQGAGGMPAFDPANMQAMLQMMGGGGMPGLPTAPEVRFESQLRQLNEMGFYDPQENIRVLTFTNGRVEAALELVGAAMRFARRAQLTQSRPPALLGSVSKCGEQSSHRLSLLHYFHCSLRL